tara:strand:+ start:139 stop:513 length:375 start_codon:yes stop_codon:yes gene_type:complete
VGFRVLKDSGKEDKVKTNRLKRQLRKSCDKITKTITEEVAKFREAASEEQLEDAFWMHAAHRAMLYIDSKSEDSFLAAELGDLFALEDFNSYERFNTHVDIDRLDKAKEKERLKQQKKNAAKEE